MRKLLKAVAIFDWITPASSVAQTIAAGGSHTFLIPEGSVRSGGQVANLLRARGIKTWGHMLVNGHYMIAVSKKQARYASQVLTKAGILQ
jgi:hypothetical protein